MAEIAQVTRDILISVFFLAGILLMVATIVFSFFLFLAMRRLLRSLTRGTENFGKVSDAAVEHIVEPLKEGVSFASTIGNALGFATGFVAGLRGRRRQGGDDGKGRGRSR